jgi:hypothetical protein
MKKKVIIYLTIVCAMCLTSSAKAAVSGLSLTKKIDPREFGMGNAGTAAANDEYAIFDNPAGLSYLNQSQLGVAYGTGLIADSMGQIIYANAGSPTGTWALGLRNYSLGDFDYLNFNGDSLRFKAQNDWILDVAFASRPASIFRYGVSFKVLHSEILEHLKATTIALDLGTTFEIFESLRLAAVIQNLGLPLSYSDDTKDFLGLPFKGGKEQEALPLTFKAGLAYDILKSAEAQPGHELLVAVNGVQELEHPWVVNAGLEYRFYSIMALRGGYSFGDGLDGLSFGAGMEYPVFSNLPMQLDYSLQLSKALNYQHKLALSLDFPPNSDRANGALVSRIALDYGPSRTKIGLGFGGSYGGPGVNVEFMTNDYIGIFGGLGAAAALDSSLGAGVSTGARFYFGGPYGILRGRGSIYATAISSGYGAVVFAASTLGLEWRFLENLGLSLDAGVASGSSYYQAIPMGDLGLVIHMCGDRPVKKDNSEGHSVEEAQPGAAVRVLPPLVGTNLQNQELLKQVFLEKFKIYESGNGSHVLSGTVFNHSENIIKALGARLTFYDAQGNTISSQDLSLIGPDAVESFARPLEGYSRRKIVFDTGNTATGYSEVFLQIIGVDEDIRPESLTIKTVIDETNSTKHPENKQNDYSSTAMVVPKLGLGFGTPYGILGGNLELMLGQLVGLYSGFGTILVTSDTGYQLGARLYLMPSGYPFRLRAGLGYGPAGVFVWQSSGGGTLHAEITNGLQPSLGFEWRLSRTFSLNFDLLYLFLEKHDAVFYYGGSNNNLHLDDGAKVALGFSFIFPGDTKGHDTGRKKIKLPVGAEEE